MDREHREYIETIERDWEAMLAYWRERVRIAQHRMWFMLGLFGFVVLTAAASIVTNNQVFLAIEVYFATVGWLLTRAWSRERRDEDARRGLTTR